MENLENLEQLEVQQKLQEVSKTLAEKLNISTEIVEEKIQKDLESYIKDIDTLSLDETIDKIDDYLFIEEVNKEYFTK